LRQDQSRPANPRSTTSRGARIAATVAERYAQSLSYRAFLAAEGERAVQQARAAAEIAARNAQAVAAAQQKLLDDFDRAAVKEDSLGNATEREHPSTSGHESNQQRAQEFTLWPELELGHGTPSGSRPARTSVAVSRAGSRGQSAKRSADAGPAHLQSTLPAVPASAGFTVRVYDDKSGVTHLDRGALPGPDSTHRNRNEARNDAEALALDEEIAFRQAPFFEEPAGPPTPLPANLIEFPRQLVASRKARPRYAEGPLRQDAGDVPGSGQLRIFEVDPTQISTQPAAAATATPQWTSIWLDGPTVAPGDPAASGPAPARSNTETPADAAGHVAFPHAASIGRRVLSAAINTAIVLVGLLAFAATFVLTTGPSTLSQPGVSRHATLGQIAASLASQTGVPQAVLPAVCAAAGGFLYLLYQALFFWFSEATPGMRCARIALCTFDDENPSRPAMRRRILAVLLSACPLGLGLLSAALDEDRLAWHDRICRMYQRSY
jgi:uncharacterized RDD family membrane protein YckC